MTLGYPRKRSVWGRKVIGSIKVFLLDLLVGLIYYQFLFDEYSISLANGIHYFPLYIRAIS